MTAKTVEELQVWQRATQFWEAVNAILDRSGFRKDWKLRDQIRDAIDSIVSNIEEGFEQPTDKAFASYLYHAKASTRESRGRLALACKRHYLNADELKHLDAIGDEVSRMLTGLIKYLLKSNRRNRGTGAPD